MTDEKLTRAILNLVRKTQDGEIRWEVWDTVPPELTEGQNGVVRQVCTAIYKDKTFRIYERHYRPFDEFRQRPTEWWDKTVLLELLDPQGRATYTFPHTTETLILWDAVRAQASGVAEIVDELSDSYPVSAN